MEISVAPLIIQYIFTKADNDADAMVILSYGAWVEGWKLGLVIWDTAYLVLIHASSMVGRQRGFVILSTHVDNATNSK